MEVVISICVVVASAIAIAVARHSEAKSFNGGKCPDCGSKLRYFDTDSQSGRGYACDKCEYITWVTFRNTDKQYTE